jgi:alginate O-acetyltransferase complex protein AlgI
MPDTSKSGMLLIITFVIIEWIQRKKEHPLDLKRLPVPIKWAFYYLLIIGIVYYTQTTEIPFIYFQF